MAQVLGRCYKGQGSNVNEDIKTALNETVVMLSDRGWHDVYDLHKYYKLSAGQIFQVIDFLNEGNLIEKNGYSIRLKPILTNVDIASLNRLRKTKRPAVLNAYQPNHLTFLSKKRYDR